MNKELYMKKKLQIAGIMFGVGISVLPLDTIGEYPYVPLYTNVVAGGTLNLASDITAHSTGSNTNEAAIVFGTNGTFNGSGGVAVYNASDGEVSGSYNLAGIVAQDSSGSVTTLTNNNTGNIRVLNDHSTYEGSLYKATRAIGIYADVIGDLKGSVSVISLAGTSNTTNANANAKATGVHNVSGSIKTNIDVEAKGGHANGSAAWAYASTYGVWDSVGKNMDGTITATSTGGSANATEGRASTYGEAYGIKGNIYGDMNGTITATATGGTAMSTNARAFAYGKAFGVYQTIGGNMNGTITATATGGSANALNIASAFGRAYGVTENINSNMTGTITAIATGGTAMSTNARAFAYGEACGINKNIAGNMNGTITAIATGGTATSENNGADAKAVAYGIGLTPTKFNGDFSGKIRVHATGGVAQGSDENVIRASAVACGIRSKDITISNFTGSIIATATAGIEKHTSDGGMSEKVSGVLARGIYADTSLYLNAHDGLIQAQVFAPEGYVLPDTAGVGKAATSIWGGSKDDSVILSRMSLIGDIDLNHGDNNITIQDDTEIYGNIYATGGALDLDVYSGILSFTDTASIQDLNSYSVKVNSNAGLGVALHAADAGKEKSALFIDGVLEIEEGATLSAKPAPGESGTGFIGETFIAITAENNLQEGATFVQAESSLFAIEITNIAHTVIITPTALKQQDAPISSSILSSVGTLNSIMNNLSKQLRSKRMFVQQNGIVSAPQGASGPSMHDGGNTSEWSIYLRQFNDLGGIDSDGNIAGYDWKTYGFLLGTEKQMGENLLIGASGGAAWTDLDGTSNSGSGDSELFNGSIYGNYFKENWYTEFGLCYGRSGNDTRRIDTASDVYAGDYDSDLFGSWIEGGYAFKISPSFTLEPYGRMAYVHGEHDGYTERAITGAAPMTVSSSSSDNLITEVGLRASNDWTFENKSIFRLGFFAGWRQEWLDDVISVNTSILGINQKASTPKADSAALILGVDADWYITNAWSIGLRYEPTFSGNWQNHAINGMLKYRF